MFYQRPPTKDIRDTSVVKQAQLMILCKEGEHILWGSVCCLGEKVLLMSYYRIWILIG